MTKFNEIVAKTHAWVLSQENEDGSQGIEAAGAALAAAIIVGALLGGAGKVAQAVQNAMQQAASILGYFLAITSPHCEGRHADVSSFVLCPALDHVLILERPRSLAAPAPRPTWVASTALVEQEFSMRRFGLFLATIALVGVFATPATIFAQTWPTNRVGDNGTNVFTIQHLLVARGYSVGIDGDFGSGTESAVRSFQSANGLGADGIVGPDTWAALVVTVRQGDQGEAVKGAQRQLNTYGYGLGVNGDFGSGTTNAVRDFQSSRGLGVDGVVGPTTWAALTSGTSGGGGGGTFALPIPRSTLPRSEYDDPHHDYAAIDLPTPTGTPAYAITSGTISLVGGGCGLGVLVTASDGSTYKYCHFDVRSVGAGDSVSAGQRIGSTGNTGNSTGPHLHMEVRASSGGALRCPQNMLLAIYDGSSVPSAASLPTSGCSY